MKSKKRAKARPKRAAKARTKAPAQRTRAKGAAKAPRMPSPATASDVAKRMAAFSSKVLDEEDAPVAVRSFVEARAGSQGSKELLPKTGALTPAEPAEDEGDEEGFDAPTPPAKGSEEGTDEGDEPRMEPMSGRLAVPKQRAEEFRVAPALTKRGRAPRVETTESYGPVELRQATATGGRHITRSNPENLQKAAGRIQPLATGGDAGRKGSKAKPERFDVAQQTRSGTRHPDVPTAAPQAKDLSDWGDIEVGQQTLSGSRKIGKLKKDEE